MNKDSEIASSLAGRVCKALSFAKETLNLLAEEGYDDPETLSDKILPEKVIGETAFLLFAASLADNSEIKRQVDEIARILIPHARSKKILLGICLHPALAIEYAQAHVFLTRLGYPDDRFDAALNKSIRSSSHFGRERSPHRMLEQEWVKRLSGDNVSTAKNYFPGIISLSALTRPIDLLHGTREDTYAYTHALMYATCFNALSWRLKKKRQIILDEAEAMLAKSLDEQDYDLTGEILLSWPLTGRGWSPSAIFALRVLMRVEDQAGFLPSPATRIETLQKLTGIKKRKYLYASAYHTAYVMGLICAAALQPGKMPPKKLPIKNKGTDALGEIMAHLKSDSPTHWQSEFERLNRQEQRALSDLMLNIALLRSIKSKQYASTYGLVKTAYEAGIGSKGLLTQAAELLDRLSLLSNVDML